MPYKDKKTGKWYTNNGEKINNPQAYFNKIRENEENEDFERNKFSGIYDSPQDEEYFEFNLKNWS